MLVPIVCFTCGLPIGDKDDLFRELMREQTEVPRDQNKKAEPKMSPAQVLDLLGIHYDCCRTRMITAMNFCDYY